MRNAPAKDSATRLGRNTENDKFEFGNLILENSKEEVVLGVTIDNKLTFDSHIKNICIKTSLKLSCIVDCWE